VSFACRKHPGRRADRSPACSGDWSDCSLLGTLSATRRLHVDNTPPIIRQSNEDLSTLLFGRRGIRWNTRTSVLACGKSELQAATHIGLQMLVLEPRVTTIFGRPGAPSLRCCLMQVWVLGSLPALLPDCRSLITDYQFLCPTGGWPAD